MEPTVSERELEWTSTMSGTADGGVVLAHEDSSARITPVARTREVREAWERDNLAVGATFAVGAGNRPIPEDADPNRTCFERDRDRILHSPAFRRLAGKTQVFIFPDDHQRTRLTHALEVAQVATAISRAVGLNVTLADAIALGHDCGHGPGGHPSEDALTPFLPDGYDHALWGADVVLAPLNLCAETTDGIRNHSWSRPAPMTPEGEVVSWADRIAYVCHDFEDAVRAGVVARDALPTEVSALTGTTQREQLNAFVRAMVATIQGSGRIGMDTAHADALGEFRRFNYHQIYARPASRRHGDLVIRVLRSLVEFYADRPNAIPDAPSMAAGSDDAVRAAVTYVAGMTDRFAFRAAVTHLDLNPDELPTGFIR